MNITHNAADNSWSITCSTETFENVLRRIWLQSCDDLIASLEDDNPTTSRYLRSRSIAAQDFWAGLVAATGSEHGHYHAVLDAIAPGETITSHDFKVNWGE